MELYCSITLECYSMPSRLSNKRKVNLYQYRDKFSHLRETQAEKKRTQGEEQAKRKKPLPPGRSKRHSPQKHQLEKTVLHQAKGPATSLQRESSAQQRAGGLRLSSFFQASISEQDD